MRLLKHGHIIKIITEYNRLFRTGTCLLLNPGNRFSLGRFLQINIHPAVPGNIYTEAIAPSFIYFLIDIYSSVRAVDSHFNTFIYIGFQILYYTFISFVASQNTFAERFIFRICIESIRKKCTYPAFEILVIENNSTEEATFSYYKELEVQGIRVLQYPKQGFNYSAINNFGVREAKGEYLLFLNNDMEVITPDFMEKMVSNLQRPQIGAVGAKLYYPDNTVQHAGIILGIGGIAGHAFLGLARGRSGYLHKASLQMNVSAVTAACMMMKKEVFEKIGGFEEELSVAFNDVDLCLRIGKAGYKIVYNPHVELYHYESKSRGAEDDEKKVRRFQSEIEFMRSRWIGLLKAGDPCYNPNLTLASWNYGLRADGRGVKPWTK